MKTKTLEQLVQLQNEPSQIRNICILAHVDHGKTTLADALIASNGIISKRNAGKMRYMDSRPDEQERGITMKSSAITLIYEKKTKGNDTNQEQFLINLIDSPGHVDFSSEVTTAVRLCDGAVVVVDVVEGVCPQTLAVLKQAWLENIRPVLVLNKLDRLISELKMTPMEAYQHLIQILEQVNLITNQLFTSEAMERVSMDTYSGEGSDSNSYDWTVIEDEEDNKTIYFAPDQGNVIFTSAVDCWGFTMADFARMYSTKLGVHEHLLHHTMWGDYYLNIKAKRIMKGAQSKGKKPLFVQFVLENIWAVYDAVIEKKDRTMTEKITKSLELVVKPRDANSKDAKVLLQAIMSQWLPLTDAVLDAVTTCTPSPVSMKEDKIEKLMCSQNIKFSSLPQRSQSLKIDFERCNASEYAPVIVYVSKMFPVERKCLPQNRARPLTEEELQSRREDARKRHAEMVAKRNAGLLDEAQNSKEYTQKNNGHVYLEESDASENGKKEDPDKVVFVAFARVFSGVLTKGKTVFFLGPKHDPKEALEELEGMNAEDYSSKQELKEKYPHITPVVIKDLYLLMGRELESLDKVAAGNVVGIGGIEDWLLKSGTLASTVACPAFTDMYFDAAPIIRVAVEPAHTGDLNQLAIGLRLLNQADSCVEVRVQETGEHVIIAAGEVHLQRCLDDLRERYAKIEINVSKPIVPFRETVIIPPTIDMVNESVQDQAQRDEEEYNDNPIQISTADRLSHLHLRAAPLPGNIANILLDNQTALKALDALSSDKSKDQINSSSLNETLLKQLSELKQLLKTEFDKSGPEWIGAEDQIWSFGPRRCGPNILLNRIKSYPRQSVWQIIEPSNSFCHAKLAEFDNSVVSGFQMATLSGPLCEEPMHGVCFIVENWWFGNGSTPPLDSSNICSVPTDRNLDCSNCDKETDVLNEGWTKCCVNSVLQRDIKNTENINSKTDDSWSVLTVSDNVQRHSSVFGPQSGQLISSVKEGCRRAFQARPQRLMAAMYICDVQATVEVLGKLHGVLGKRFGHVLSEEMQEGSNTFTVSASLPVVESFGFSEDMRKKTSGLASPQLRFSHWELISVDPFWVPTTEEEYMHFGEKADAENRARHYMNKVRKRKGLKTDEKIVEFGDKQRTLTKMK